MKHKLLSMMLLLGVLSQASAQQVLKLSLNEAREHALQHNKTLQNAQIDRQIADSKLKGAIAQGLPQVDAGVDYSTYFGYEMDFSFGSGGDYSFTQEQIMAATQQAKQTFAGIPALGIQGATDQDIYNYQAGSYFSSQLQAAMPPSTIKMTDQLTGKIQLGQLLFSGQYWAGIQAAKLGQKIAKQGYENSVIDVKESVTNSYFMVLATEHTLKIFEKNIENLKAIKNHTQAMYEAGIAEQTDVDQISIQVTMLENTFRSMQRTKQMGYNLLKFQLGVDSETGIELSESIETFLADAGSRNTQSFDINQNMMYQLTETQEEISEKMVDMERWSYAPTVTGFYAYNQKFMTTGFDMTPNNMAGVSVSIPVFSSGMRKHKVAQAQLQLDQARINKAMVNDQLLMQEKQLVFNYNTALEDYESQKENVSVAQRAFENINRKFSQGMVSSLDLTQSHSNYLQSETSFIQASLSLLQAKIALEKLYNQL